MDYSTVVFSCCYLRIGVLCVSWSIHSDTIAASKNCCSVCKTLSMESKISLDAVGPVLAYFISLALK
jgi:hypothetical protein